MAQFDDLVKQAHKAARDMGGLASLLLTVQSRKVNDIQWDAKKVRFIVNGRTISIVSIRKELMRINTTLARKVEEYNYLLQLKVWSITKWREEMLKLIQNSHIILAALTVGTIAAAVAEPTTLRRIDRDIGALARYTTAIKQKTIPSNLSMLNRSRAYLRSFAVTYHVLLHRAHIRAGFTEAKRMLSSAEHCRSGSLKDGTFVEGCLEVANKGWMPIRDMPILGSLRCKQWCLCWIIFRK